MGAFPWGQLIPGGPGVTTGFVMVQDIVYRALRLIQVSAAPGRGPSSEQLAEGFNVLNAMCDSWNTERLMVYVMPRNVFTLIPGKGTSTNPYTIGPGADWNTGTQPRPPKIERAGLIDISNPSMPLELPMSIYTVEDYSRVPVKDISSTLPFALYYDRQYNPVVNPGYQTVGVGNVFLYPIPQVANQIALYMWQIIPGFNTLQDAVVLPPGYLGALQYNLAVELAPGFPKAKLTPTVLAKAIEYKARIKSLNPENLETFCDPAVSQGRSYGWNYLTGDYRR